MNEALTAAYTFPLIVACFTVHSRVSDDQFLEFRAWLILHGRAAFERAIENPDSITKFLTKDQVDEIKCAGFPELPTRLWLDRGGNILEYREKVGFTPIPQVKQDWPENPQEFKERSTRFCTGPTGIPAASRRSRGSPLPWRQNLADANRQVTQKTRSRVEPSEF